MTFLAEHILLIEGAALTFFGKRGGGEKQPLPGPGRKLISQLLHISDA